METATPGKVSGRQTVVGLDILRLFAALLVVSYHFLFFSWVEPAGYGGIRDAVGASIAFPDALPFAWWGWIGVELFFVISGFVITRSALGNSASGFAAGRIVRLYPALFFFSIWPFLIMAGTGLLPFGKALIRWLRTVTLFPKGPWIDGVIWTLTVEVVFYLVIFLILLSGQVARLPSLMRYALGIVTAFWSLVIMSHLFGMGSIGTFVQTVAFAYPSRVILLTTGAFFLLGMFAQEMFDQGITAERIGCAALATFDCLTAIYHSALRSEGITIFAQNPLVPMLAWLTSCLACALAVMAERRRQPGPQYRAFARRAGLLTYPLYLMHNITGGWIMGRLRDAGATRAAAALLSLLICLSCSYLFTLRIEPVLQKLVRHRLPPRRSPARSEA